MDNFLDTMQKIWENSFVKALVYLVLAFVLAFVASFIAKKLFKLIGLEKRLDGWGINDGQSGTAGKFVGKLVFLIVFLLFFPSVLDALGLDGVNEPIMNLVDTFISYIPNIIAAAILIFVGIFIGQILSQVISVLLSKTKIDNLKGRLSKSLSKSTEMEENNENSTKISVVIGKTIYALVVLIAVAEALSILNIEAISKPALSIITTIFEAIPNVILAFLIILLGFVLANIVSSLVESLLIGLGLDALLKKSMPGVKMNFSISKIITGTVRVVIILFVLAQGVDVLGLEVFSEIMSVIIGYLPEIIKAIAIAILALVLANLTEGLIKSSMGQALAKIAKAAIYTVAGFMILSQLNFASTIVNFAFIIVLAAIAVAFAISFGIGGRDFAKKSLEGLKMTDKDSNPDKKAEKSDNTDSNKEQ